MKINPISFLNLNNFQSFSGCNTVKSNNNQQFDYNKTFNSAEILGRSQVNFTSNNDKNKIFQEYDKKFIDTVSQNLRLSDEEKIRFNNDVKDFLKTNKIKSLENLVGAENAEMQAEFIGEVGDDICHSDFDFNILSDAFYDRVYYEGEYKPEVSLYDKDYEVIDHILDKYNCDEGKKCEVFDI
jgi:hypothetical protein